MVSVAVIVPMVSNVDTVTMVDITSLLHIVALWVNKPNVEWID